MLIRQKMLIDDHSPATKLESNLHSSFRRAAGRIYLISYLTRAGKNQHLRLVRLGKASKTVIGTKIDFCESSEANSFIR